MQQPNTQQPSIQQGLYVQPYQPPQNAQQSHYQQAFDGGAYQGSAEALNASTTTTTTTTQQIYANQQHQHQQQQQPNPQPQPRVDYTQLQQLSSLPPPKPATDYTKLAQATYSTDLTPQDQHAHNTTTNTTTTNTAFNQAAKNGDLGGKARQAASAKGESELRRFDRSVEERLRMASGSSCRRGFKYYRVRDGYLCGGGNHYVSHDDVDAMVTFGMPPFVESVNSLGCRSIAPPADAWHERMHWTPARRIANGMEPLPFKANGEPHDMRPAMGVMLRYGSPFI